MHAGLIIDVLRQFKKTFIPFIFSQLLMNAFSEEVKRPDSEEDQIVKRSPLIINTSMETGQIINGTYLLQPDYTIDGEFHSRTGVWLTQMVSIHDIVGMDGGLDLIMGAGGLFFYVWPEIVGAAYTKGTKFGPGISQAQAIFKFGDIADPKATLQFGYFPIKYNPDAVNLGEYLFRSGTYPGFVFTGGWNIVNNALYMAQGIRLSFSNFDGRLTHDFTLFMERDYSPQFDFTPSYLVNWDLDFIEFGAAASFSHYLPVKPSRLEPKHPLNTYVEFESFPQIPWVIDTNFRGEIDTIQFPRGAGPQAGILKEFENLEDLNGGNPFEEKIFTDTLTLVTRINKDDPLYVADPNAYVETEEFRYKRTNTYYTFKGIKLMARFALDLKEIFPSENFTPSDMRLYAEVALLGVKDYPFYYDNKTERMPMMFGFNFPTYRLLDVLSIQMEYFNSPYINNMRYFVDEAVPVWSIPDVELPYASRYISNKDNTGDNWKWSIYGKRHIFKGIDLFFQVASDHFRFIQPTNQFSFESVLADPSEWYYMTRLEFGI